jgi:hypothetical protein
MNKKIYILLFVTFGFLLIPSIVAACGSSCGKEKTTKTEAKDCCDSKKQSQQKATEKGCCDSSEHDKKDDGCGGKCKHPSCNCIAPVLNIVLTSFLELKAHNNFDFSNEKQRFTFEESTTSSGFYYIWTPPNIS